MTGRVRRSPVSVEYISKSSYSGKKNTKGFYILSLILFFTFLVSYPGLLYFEEGRKVFRHFRSQKDVRWRNKRKKGPLLRNEIIERDGVKKDDTKIVCSIGLIWSKGTQGFRGRNYLSLSNLILNYFFSSTGSTTVLETSTIDKRHCEGITRLV